MIRKGEEITQRLMKKYTPIILAESLQESSEKRSDGVPSEKEEVFANLERICKKGNVDDYDIELASYKEEKYGR